jgi:metallo-beta-lactamase class B
MKRYCMTLFFGAFVLAGATLYAAGAADIPASVQKHTDIAKAAAYRPGHDLTSLYEAVCRPALAGKARDENPPKTDPAPGSTKLSDYKVPPRSEWYREPAKVFDNLYWLGSHSDSLATPPVFGNSIWAVKTSEGIILIDSSMNFSQKELITDGLKKLGEDPAQIKYLILTHAHSDRYWGAKYVQDTYHAHLITSEADWHGIEISPDPNEVKPKKDMVATDGMKLTLGDTTLTIYLTPGHTPGTISVLVPLKDGNQKHLGAVWGGINPNLYGHGVRNGPTLEAVIKTWTASAVRFMDIANKAGVDVYLTIHPGYDMAENKIRALPYRKPGEPHPFVSKDETARFLTIIKECNDAQLARLESTHD